MLDRYLDVPASTTPETIALANQLAEGHTSTYSVIRAYEAWMAENVTYDLNAPVPADGVDAVHDFLFNSRPGFCEQIASALTVMLRTQGVPARLATGYAAGTRDRVAGVWEVRGSDAHAWVEVWVPEVGWQAFDPTASVPLSGDAQVASVGADLADGFSQFVAAHRRSAVAIVVAAIVVVLGARLLIEVRRRRRRGRWGVLQDRFTRVALRRGAPEGASNPAQAAAWTDADDAALAQAAAALLDRAAFDPLFDDDSEAFAEARRMVGQLTR
jgi:hypothetical protein